MGERPIELASLCIDRTEGKSVIADASHGDDLGIISRRKNLVCLFEIPVRERFLHNLHTTVAQQPDYPLSRNACQKRAIGKRREHHSVFHHEDIGGGEFGDVAQHIAYDCIVEAAGLGLKERA